MKKWFKKKISQKNYALRAFSPFQNFDYPSDTIITHGLYLLNPLFEGQNHFSRRFFEKIVPYSMVSIQERFVIKSKVWWRAYGILYLHRQTSVVIKKSSNDNFFVQNDEVFTQTPLFDDFLMTTWEQQEKNQKFHAYSCVHFSSDEVLRFWNYP